ncbi:hypothetical protein ACIRS1_07590 [Kitasatospora sp. NPDC101176]|uniref:hypothetical protein n=1 Tax=Kitasatospora sp. NPDC101176 TaxID=3364099 RepID=UPI0037FEADB2
MNLLDGNTTATGVSTTADALRSGAVTAVGRGRRMASQAAQTVRPGLAAAGRTTRSAVRTGLRTARQSMPGGRHGARAGLAAPAAKVSPAARSGVVAAAAAAAVVGLVVWRRRS